MTQTTAPIRATTQEFLEIEDIIDDTRPEEKSEHKGTSAPGEDNGAGS